MNTDGTVLRIHGQVKVISPDDEIRYQLIPLNLCEHCLAAFYDGELIDFNDLGEEIFEEQTRPELFNSEDVDHNYMVATGSNFILSNLTGGMACGPVWGQLDLVFEAYPERLEREDNEG